MATYSLVSSITSGDARRMTSRLSLIDLRASKMALLMKGRGAWSMVWRGNFAPYRLTGLEPGVSETAPCYHHVPNSLQYGAPRKVNCTSSPIIRFEATPSAIEGKEGGCQWEGIRNWNPDEATCSCRK